MDVLLPILGTFLCFFIGLIVTRYVFAIRYFQKQAEAQTRLLAIIAKGVNPSEIKEINNILGKATNTDIKSVSN